MRFILILLLSPLVACAQSGIHVEYDLNAQKLKFDMENTSVARHTGQDLDVKLPASLIDPSIDSDQMITVSINNEHKPISGDAALLGVALGAAASGGNPLAMLLGGLGGAAGSRAASTITGDDSSSKPPPESEVQTSEPESEVKEEPEPLQKESEEVSYEDALSQFRETRSEEEIEEVKKEEFPHIDRVECKICGNF